jgi:hypothetical protein
MTSILRNQTRDDVKSGALPAARGAQKDDELFFLDRKGKVTDSGFAAIRFGDVL